MKKCRQRKQNSRRPAKNRRRIRNLKTSRSQLKKQRFLNRKISLQSQLLSRPKSQMRPKRLRRNRPRKRRRTRRIVNRLPCRSPSLSLSLNPSPSLNSRSRSTLPRLARQAVKSPPAMITKHHRQRQQRQAENLQVFKTLNPHLQRPIRLWRNPRPMMAHHMCRRSPMSNLNLHLNQSLQAHR